MRYLRFLGFGFLEREGRFFGFGEPLERCVFLFGTHQEHHSRRICNYGSPFMQQRRVNI